MKLNIGCARWQPEYHHQSLLATDASLFRYGVAIMSGIMNGMNFGDYWLEGDERPIHLKESEALLKAVQSLDTSTKIRDHRLDMLTDNQAVLHT